MQTDNVIRQILESPTPLISADQLEQVLDVPTVKVFDIRGTWKSPARALPDDYAAGHIPGACFLDWTRHFVQQGVPIGMAQVADEAGAERAFADLGINDGDLVVLYDDYHHMLAGRLWWAMRHWGFADVRVLNGGWAHWLAQEKPVSTAPVAHEAGTFQPRRQDNTRVSLDEFVGTKDKACVLDGRGAQSFAGTPGDERTGHIPGTLNLPYSAVLDPETGLMLDQAALSKAFDAAAPHWRTAPIITTCGSGYAATVLLLALAEQGQGARLFDGSFAHWKQDPARPIAQVAP